MYSMSRTLIIFCLFFCFWRVCWIFLTYFKIDGFVFRFFSWKSCIRFLSHSQIFFFLKIVTLAADIMYFLAIVCICLFKEVIHCRIYQLVKSQWKRENYLVLLLLPWRVLLLIDLYNYIYLLIFNQLLSSWFFFA